MSELIVCTPDPQALQAAYHIHQQVVPQPWRFDTFIDCTTAPYCARVVLQEHRVIGYALLLMVVDEATLMDIGIAEDARGIGAGGHLLQAIIAHCKACHMASLWLEVRSSNQIARQLYSKAGFSIQEVRKGYYPATAHTPCEDAVIMTMSLNA